MMTKSAPQDTHEDPGAHEGPTDDHAETGHSGEGAASALAHMISRGQQQRHQTGDADDAAGRAQ